MIQCSDVSFSYDGETQILNDVNLTVADGEFVCVLGGNGCGKSTLAKHLNGLLAPTGGSVKIDGMDTSDPEFIYDIRSRVGMVFQNPDDQLVATLVENDIAFGPENLGLSPQDIRGRVSEALENVGLAGFEQHETNALSGGQKQRIAIAGILAMHPSMLILDEASSMLDPRGRRGLMKVCCSLHDAGMTIVMITHYMEEAAEADRVVVMEHGHIALEGTPDEVLTQAEVLKRLNLEVPYSCQLGYELASRGIDVALGVNERTMVSNILEAIPHAAEVAEAPRAERVPAPDAPSPAETPLIEFQHVYYSYDKSKSKKARRKAAMSDQSKTLWGNDPSSPWALADASFEVRRGEFLGVAGHTGSGKSTIIQHMNGLAQPASGRVLIEGRDLADKSIAEAVKTKVGLVFQYPEHQLFANTVYEDVAFGPRNLGCSADEVDERVRRALQQVNLDFDAIARKSPFELSGGQQRRVAFAGVLAMNPEVLVLDEPVAGLDPASRRDFLGFVSRLHKDGLTVVMVSHCMEDLATYCDRVLLMNKGGIAMRGTPQQVFVDAAPLKDIGLDSPAPQRMATSLIAQGIPLRRGHLYDIDGLASDLVLIAQGGEL